MCCATQCYRGKHVELSNWLICSLEFDEVRRVYNSSYWTLSYNIIISIQIDIECFITSKRYPFQKSRHNSCCHKNSKGEFSHLVYITDATVTSAMTHMVFPKLTKPVCTCSRGNNADVGINNRLFDSFAVWRLMKQHVFHNNSPIVINVSLV